MIERITFAEQKIARWRCLQRFQQSRYRAKIQLPTTPIKGAQRFKVMLFNCIDDFRIKFTAPVGNAEGAIINMTPRTARDLGHLRRCQFAQMATIKFYISRQRNMA